MRISDWSSDVCSSDHEELIRGKLEARFPEDGGLGEETGASQGGAAGQAVWVVDPIDGTSCFLGGMPTWCVSIALVMNGEIEIGVIHDTNRSEERRVGKARVSKGRTRWSPIH